MTNTRGHATRRFLAAIDHRRPEPVDWDSAPPRYKRYRNTARAALPTTGPESWKGDLLRGLLGLTRVSWNHPTDEAGRLLPGPRSILIGRPVASGGALYPIEAYLADRTALHHYDIVHHTLETVRDGDHRTTLLPQTGAADVALVLTAVFWRNGFKYRDFAYRLACQEVGALCGQALVLAEASGLNASVHLNFDGDLVEQALGLTPAAEGALAMLTFTSQHSDSRRPRRRAPTDRGAAQPADPPIPVTHLLPHLAELHAEARALQPLSPPSSRRPPALPGPGPALPPVKEVDLARGIPHRASPLNGYRRSPLTLTELAQILAAAQPGNRATVGLRVLVWNVAGIPAGAYHYDSDRHELTGGGPPTVEAGPLHTNTRLALNGAAAALIPMGAPLAEAAAHGDRAYRLQQLEAGMAAHRASLAAAALGLTSRIHSDGTNPTTDAVLGLTGTPWRSLSFLLLGHRHPNGPTLTRRPDQRGTPSQPHDHNKE